MAPKQKRKKQDEVPVSGEDFSLEQQSQQRKTRGRKGGSNKDKPETEDDLAGRRQGVHSEDEELADEDDEDDEEEEEEAAGEDEDEDEHSLFGDNSEEDEEDEKGEQPKGKKTKKKPADVQFLHAIPGLSADKASQKELAKLAAKVPGLADVLNQATFARGESSHTGGAGRRKKKGEHKGKKYVVELSSSEDDEQRKRVIKRRVYVWSACATDASSVFVFLKTWMEEIHIAVRIYVTTENMESSIVSACAVLYDLLSSRYPDQFPDPAEDKMACTDFTGFAKKGVLMCSPQRCVR